MDAPLRRIDLVSGNIVNAQSRRDISAANTIADAADIALPTGASHLAE